MAPPPEYDKEPKAPDKSVTNIPIEDSKTVYNHLVNEPQNNSEAKTTNSSANAEVENNKHVEALDDGQLRALLDEAITYKCPKDREGKSNLFKELLESVEQDEQACEAAARTAGRARRAGGGRGRRALPHSNSLQDLVAALAAEPAPRRRAHAPAPAPVSARALHGGSLPSGVDTSSLGEEARAGGAEYVATVRCVNPAPLAERRVSASDAPDAEPRDRRSKPSFPLTYTARATLEIGSGGAGPGRAVTVTTASNQVRTPPAARPRAPPRARRARRARRALVVDPPNVRSMTVARAPPAGDCRPDANDDDIPADNVYRTKIYHPSVSKQIDLKRNSNPNVSFKTHKAPKEHRSNTPKTVKETELDEVVEKPLKTIDKQKKNPSQPISNKPNPNPKTPSRTNIEDHKTKYATMSQEQARIDKLDTMNPMERLEMLALKRASNKIDKQSKIPSHTGSKTNPDSNFPSKTIIKDDKTKNTTMDREDARGDKHETVNETELVEMVSLNRSSKTLDKQNKSISPSNSKNTKSNPAITLKTNNENDKTETNANDQKELQINKPETVNDTELVEMVSLNRSSNSNEFSLFIANQQRLLQAIENNNCSELDNQVKCFDVKPSKNYGSESLTTMKDIEQNPGKPSGARGSVDAVSMMDCSADKESEPEITEVVKIKRAGDFKVSKEKCAPAEVASNAAILLTLYKRLLASPCSADAARGGKGAGEADAAKPKKKKITARLSRKPSDNTNIKKDIIRNALKKLIFDNITQSDCTKLCGKAGAASKEVDSAIPFSCITTPEVVAGCATTAAPAQSAVPADLKPLQDPGSRAAAGVAGAPSRADLPDAVQIPRTALAGGLAAHGVVPRAAALGAAAADEFKKSLDENGNAVPTFASPHQQKKQRRKKSSKNETVIKSHQIDGYQGNKDLNEVLRFIESAEPERQAKRDDKKKRSAERRKEKPPRASSLDALSRAAAAPAALTAARPAPSKPERRSWGDDARAYFRDPEPDALELTDFQTVTKKRKPRRRADEPEPRRAPAPPSPPSPRARSDRSDSNDDLDSVHSLPALPSRAPQPPLASYADIARTRHNIPDLIESCNYYAEGEEPRPDDAGPTTPGDADGYPALEARARRRRELKPRAPDVLDRRPPVLLRDAGRPRDLDGVTFGFAVNEQLLGGLLRRAPPPPPDARLLQLVDYVGSAWEDVLRGGGKVRYFSE